VTVQPTRVGANLWMAGQRGNADAVIEPQERVLANSERLLGAEHAGHTGRPRRATRAPQR
jgi:hypothetical protein